MRIIAFSFILMAFLRIDAVGQTTIVSMFNIIPVANNGSQTFTKGEKITGEPFFINEWLKGTVILQNGETYNRYQLKYNTYNQTLLFLNGKESIEIDQPINEFMLLAEGVRPVYFIRADAYNTKQKGYFERVSDLPQCQLLRLNKKTSESVSPMLTALNDSKTFENSSDFFIFDKSLNKLTSYKKAAPALKAMFNLNGY